MLPVIGDNVDNQVDCPVDSLVVQVFHLLQIGFGQETEHARYHDEAYQVDIKDTD